MIAGFEIDLHAGLFIYSGLGCGTLFVASETGEGFDRFSCCGEEAAGVCSKLGLTYRYVDKFAGYVPTYVGD